MIKSFIGKRIRLMRNRAGYSQESFAKVCGLDRTYIAGVELGRRNISIENLNKIAEALNLTLAELCDDSVPANRTILLKVRGQAFILERQSFLQRSKIILKPYAAVHTMKIQSSPSNSKKAVQKVLFTN